MSELNDDTFNYKKTDAETEDQDVLQLQALKTTAELCTGSLNTDNPKPKESLIDAFSSHLLQGVSQHADALTMAIKQNSEEVQKLEVTYQKLEEQMSREKTEHDNVLRDCHRLIGELCTLETESIKSKQNIKNLKVEITKTLWEKHLVKLQVARKEGELQDLKQKKSINDYKMEGVRKKIAEVEAQTEVEKELSSLKQEIAGLKDQKINVHQKKLDLLPTHDGAVMTGAEIEEEIRDLKMQLTRQKSVLASKQAEIEQLKLDNSKMEATNKILEKRNSALLIRFNKRVGDRKETYVAWKKRTEFLQHQIKLMTDRLQKIKDEPEMFSQNESIS